MGVPYRCPRMGGRDKGNTPRRRISQSEYEKLRRRKKKWRSVLVLPREARQSKFAVRIFFKKSSDFNQKVPPIFRIRILGDCCLAPPKAGLGFGKDFEGIFEIQKQFLPAQSEVRFAEGKYKFEKFINQSFFFRLWRKAKR